MKYFILLVILILNISSFAQQASDYFPPQTGYKWNYKVIPLDSANNQVDSLAFFRADSFAAEINFMGQNADLVLSKSGPLNVINYLPYTDSSFFSFENSNGHQYFRISNLGNLLTVLDSIGFDSSSIGIILSFEDWYSVYRFAQPVGSQYTIFSKDTTINLNGTNLPLRFEYLGKRLADETIQTEAGSFLCKKFQLSTVVSYVLFPPIVIPLITLETNKWLSENVWLVQELTPSQTIDLSYLGYGSFTLPGLKTILIPLIVPVELESFTADIEGNNVKLNWVTATEVNNRGFQIERNQNEKQPNWINIGFVEGNGTTTKPVNYSFTDRNSSDIHSQYRLKQTDYNGNYTYSKVIESGNNIVHEFSLAQNYPNPFNPSTKIDFSLPESGNVSLIVYNTLGEEVTTLLNEQKNAGNYSVMFNSESGKISSGIYFYVLKFKGMQISRKMIFLK